MRTAKTARTIAAAAALFCAAPAGARAQEANPDAGRAALTNVRTFDPELQSPTRSAVPSVVVSAVRGDGEARAQAGFQMGQLAAVLAASAPFTGKASAPATELASDAGLASGTKLSLTLSGLVWGPSRISNAQSAARETWCEARAKAGAFTEQEIRCESVSRSKLLALASPPAPLPQQEVDNLVAEFRGAPDKIKWCGDQREKGRIPPSLSCTAVTEDALRALATPRRAHPADSVDALVRDFDRVSRLGWDVPVQYGFQASFSPQTFDFLDPQTLESGSRTRTGVGVGAGVGIFVRPFTRIDADVSYERAFRAGRTAQVCTPLPPASSSQCAEAVLGAPTRTRGWVLDAGIRQFSHAGGLDLGFNPRVSYRTQDRSYTARVPIYLLPEKGGTALLGGIAPTWSSQSKRFGIVLFVGSAFNLDGPAL